MTDDLNTIYSEADWLDLRVGEQAILQGKSNNAKKGAAAILVGMPDWSDILVTYLKRLDLTEIFLKEHASR